MIVGNSGVVGVPFSRAFSRRSENDTSRRWQRGSFPRPLMVTLILSANRGAPAYAQFFGATVNVSVSKRKRQNKRAESRETEGVIVIE